MAIVAAGSFAAFLLKTVQYVDTVFEELLKLAAEGGFTTEAEQVLRTELARRNSRSMRQSGALLLNGSIEQRPAPLVSLHAEGASRGLHP